MSDLIRKSALVDRLSDAAVKAGEIEEGACANACTYYAGIKCGFWNAAIIADNFPTIDAVPVVRCKDCKHYQFADNRAFGMPVKMCEWFGFEDVDDNDYCSRAERREE